MFNQNNITFTPLPELEIEIPWLSYLTVGIIRLFVSLSEGNGVISWWVWFMKESVFYHIYS